MFGKHWWCFIVPHRRWFMMHFWVFTVQSAHSIPHFVLSFYWYGNFSTSLRRKKFYAIVQTCLNFLSRFYYSNADTASHFVAEKSFHKAGLSRPILAEASAGVCECFLRMYQNTESVLSDQWAPDLWGPPTAWRTLTQSAERCLQCLHLGNPSAHVPWCPSCSCSCRGCYDLKILIPQTELINVRYNIFSKGIILIIYVCDRMPSVVQLVFM